MLSMQRCREILGAKCDLDDQQIEKLRDQLYGIADVVIDQISISRSTRPQTDAKGFIPALTLLHEEDREEIEERAAIIEYEAGTSRDEAERRAILTIIRRHHETKP